MGNTCNNCQEQALEGHDQRKLGCDDQHVQLPTRPLTADKQVDKLAAALKSGREAMGNGMPLPMHSSRLALDDEADKAGAAGKVYIETMDGKEKIEAERKERIFVQNVPPPSILVCDCLPHALTMLQVFTELVRGIEGKNAANEEDYVAKLQAS